MCLETPKLHENQFYIEETNKRAEKREKSRTSDNTMMELKRIGTGAEMKDPGEKRIDLKAPGMTYKERNRRSREGDRKLKQPQDVTRWKAKNRRLNTRRNRLQQKS